MRVIYSNIGGTEDCVIFRTGVPDSADHCFEGFAVHEYTREVGGVRTRVHVTYVWTVRQWATQPARFQVELVDALTGETVYEAIVHANDLESAISLAISRVP